MTVVSVLTDLAKLNILSSPDVANVNKCYPTGGRLGSDKRSVTLGFSVFRVKCRVVGMIETGKSPFDTKRTTLWNLSASNR